MTDPTLHRLPHGAPSPEPRIDGEPPEQAQAEGALRELSREELFLALQKASEESRTARRWATDNARRAENALSSPRPETGAVSG